MFEISMRNTTRNLAFALGPHSGKPLRTPTHPPTPWYTPLHDSQITRPGRPSLYSASTTLELRQCPGGGADHRSVV